MEFVEISLYKLGKVILNGWTHFTNTTNFKVEEFLIWCCISTQITSDSVKDSLSDHPLFFLYKIITKSVYR